jgi:hypothetical protein
MGLEMGRRLKRMRTQLRPRRPLVWLKRTVQFPDARSSFRVPHACWLVQWHGEFSLWRRTGVLLLRTTYFMRISSVCCLGNPCPFLRLEVNSKPARQNRVEGDIGVSRNSAGSFDNFDSSRTCCHIRGCRRWRVCPLFLVISLSQTGPWFRSYQHLSSSLD